MSHPEHIHLFRDFNRFYTDYLGLLGNSLYNRPVNLTEARILFELDATPNISAKEVMAKLHLDKGYVSRLLKRFSREGWVEQQASEKDARVKLLRLAPDGQELMAQLHNDAAKQAAEALDGLNEDERDQLLGAMSAIRNILSA